MAVMAWQGLGVEVSSRWCPIKLEGDFSRGYALLADMHRPRLGIRWDTPRRRNVDPGLLVKKAMTEEVGTLAADESRPLVVAGLEHGLLYTEPAPPGRDVWIGWSPATGRVVEIIHHARRRERILRELILPTLVDDGANEVLPWSVFDLSCLLPAQYKLKSRELNAGDLSLTFSARDQWMRVRQIAVAQVALKRRTLDKWLKAEQGRERKYYRPNVAKATQAEGRLVETMRRRRRFFFAWKLPRMITTIALHDEARDRLVIVQGSNGELVKQVIESIGWASQAFSPGNMKEI